MLQEVVEALAGAAGEIAKAATPDPVARRLAQVKGIERVHVRDGKVHARQIRAATEALRRAMDADDHEATVAAIVRLRSLGVTAEAVREAAALAVELEVQDVQQEADADSSPVEAPVTRRKRRKAST